MGHPNEELLRMAYAAFLKGDLDGYLSHCTDDITFTIPGKGLTSGVYSRSEFVRPLISKVIDLTNGTFVEVLSAVIANDESGVVLARHEFFRKGRQFSYDIAHVYRIKDGKLAQFSEYLADLYAFDEAWS